MKVLESNKICISPNAEVTLQSISTKNIAKATYILRDKIYSDKKKAAFCETLCNAFDEHVKHNIEKPIDIIITQNEVCIRDYALGLPEKEVLNVFFQYFESTKSESNDSIGGFGIGAKAPGAYSSTYYVESFYNGKKTIYASVVDGFTSKVIKFHTEDIDKNDTGICVRIPIQNKNDYQEFVNLANDMVQQIGFDQPNYNKRINRYVIPDEADYYDEWCKLSEEDKKAYLLPPLPYTQHLRYIFDKFADKESNVFLFNKFCDNDVVFWSNFFNGCRVSRASYHHYSDTNLYFYDGDMLYKSDESITKIIEQSGKKVSDDDISYSSLNNICIIIKFNRGELPVSPSRERIEMTDAVKKWVCEKIKLYFSNNKKKLISDIKKFYLNNIPLTFIFNLCKTYSFYDYCFSTRNFYRVLIDKKYKDELCMLYKEQPYNKTVKRGSLIGDNISSANIICISNSLSQLSIYQTYNNYITDYYNNLKIEFEKNNINIFDKNTLDRHCKYVIKCDLNKPNCKEFYDKLEKGEVYAEILGEKFALRKNIDYFDFSSFDKKYVYSTAKNKPIVIKKDATKSSKGKLIDIVYGTEIPKEEYKDTFILTYDRCTNSDFVNDLYKVRGLLHYQIKEVNNLCNILGIKHIAKCPPTLAKDYIENHNCHKFNDGSYIAEKVLKCLLDSNIIILESSAFINFNSLFSSDTNVITITNKNKQNVHFVEHCAITDITGLKVKLSDNTKINLSDLFSVLKRFYPGSYRSLFYPFTEKYSAFIENIFNKISDEDLTLLYHLQIIKMVPDYHIQVFNRQKYYDIKNSIIDKFIKDNAKQLKEITERYFDYDMIINKAKEIIESK